MTLRPDLALISGLIPTGSRVLDVGCGDGALMAALRDRGVDARGLELSSDGVAAAVGQGLPVVQGNADTDLDAYPDAAFDYAILSQTLQATRAPAEVLDSLLRIAGRAIVSFPNFGHWRVRMSLLWGGRMPTTRTLPARWDETGNIHLCSIDDFRALTQELGIQVERAWFLRGGEQTSAAAANLLAEQGVFMLRRR